MIERILLGRAIVQIKRQEKQSTFGRTFASQQRYCGLHRMAALKQQAASERTRFEEASSRTEEVVSELQEANEKLAEGHAAYRSKVSPSVEI